VYNCHILAGHPAVPVAIKRGIIWAMTMRFITLI
jgi:hypothetical protein